MQKKWYLKFQHFALFLIHTYGSGIKNIVVHVFFYKNENWSFLFFASISGTQVS